MRTFSIALTILASITLVACQRDANSSPSADPDNAALAPSVAPSSAHTSTAETASATTPANADTESQCGGSCGGGSCGGGSCGGGCGGAAPVMADDSSLPSDVVWTTLEVAGMRCGGCENRIKRELAGVDGVLTVRADHGTGRVEIATASSIRDVRGELAPRITKLGFYVHQ